MFAAMVKFWIRYVDVVLLLGKGLEAELHRFISCLDHNQCNIFLTLKFLDLNIKKVTILKLSLLESLLQ